MYDVLCAWSLIRNLVRFLYVYVSSELMQVEGLELVGVETLDEAVIHAFDCPPQDSAFLTGTQRY